MTHTSLKYTRLSATLAAALFVLSMQGQTSPYKYAYGARAGVSGYLGEANRSSLFAHPGFDAELYGAYIYDVRWTFSSTLSTFGLSGNSADVPNVLPDNKQFSFNTQVYELAARTEYNFLPYGIGESFKHLRPWTPYITVGLGLGIANTQDGIAAALTLPMGLGVKYKLRPRLNLMAEFSMTKAFSDRFDSQDLAEVNTISKAFYKNTDWYSRLSVGISYEIGERCETCHYVE